MSEKKSLYMETTRIPAQRTAAEISALLVRAGATQINTEYHAGNIVGLSWTIKADGRNLVFEMPARVEPVYQILKKRRVRSLPQKEPEIRQQAERVAWRQLLRWTESQLALIECGMAQPSEVFFAYVVHAHSGKTMYELFSAEQFKRLSAPQ